ncbi:hypothetical protein [Pontibacter oryzae]|uniref:Uncharacterized protein n=1 Tax=Pontibacter oryzae TaxID=2304593 RepID=A0A399SI02_9BACT|nr:hypothetical protein [Pontibacter oryzae]RIJ42664.1 hypothetical protein D1627_02070 [Pontibacter oryzae]
MSFKLPQEVFDQIVLAAQQGCENAFLKYKKETPSPLPPLIKEFFTEPESREFLGGISRSLFNKIRKQGMLNTYYCGEGRCLFSREELIYYIKNNNPSLTPKMQIAA